MVIEAKEYSPEKKSLEVEITPKYILLAVNKDADVDKELITDGAGQNAVIVGEGTEDLPVGDTTRVTINFQLPAGFIDEGDMENLYVVHTKENGTEETYKADVTKSGDIYTATFTTNGFSPFVFKVDNRTASVQFTDKDSGNEGGVQNYTPANVGTALPTTEAPAGQRFSGWKFEGIEGTYTKLTEELLTKLDEKDSTVTATPVFYTPSTPVVTKYEVNVSETENGKTEVSTAKAAAGSTVRITATADELYIVETVTVTTAEGETVEVTKVSDREYTFIMPAGDVTVKAEYKHECPSGKYTDVNENEWYHEAVDYVISHKMMIGISESEFMPKGSTSRGQIVTILYRLEKEPEVSGGTEFEDVSAGSYYAEAVKWAESNEIMLGYGDGRFGPEDGITREQLAAILYRYAEYKGYEIKGSEELTGYTDAGKVSGWAEEAMKWSCGNGLILGGDGDKLDPQGGAERSQAAAILMRFCETIGK